MASNSNSSGGIGFLGLLTLLFITLKFTHFIEWPWVWVLSPLWIPACIGVVVMIVLAGFWLYSKRSLKKKLKAMGKTEKDFEAIIKPKSAWAKKLEEMQNRHN